GIDDLVVGTPVAGRDRPEVEHLVGLFVNTLVLRVDLSDNPRFGTLVERAHETVLDALAHQDIPFEQVVEGLNPHRTVAYQPLVNVMFTFLNEPTRIELERLGPDVELLEIDRGTANRDLTLRVDRGTACRFEYNADLFDAPTIECVAAGYEAVLRQVVT